MSLIIWALLAPALATDAPFPSYWPYDGLTDVPTDGKLLSLCSRGGLILQLNGQAVLQPQDLWLAETEYEILSTQDSTVIASFTTGTKLAQPVETAPKGLSVQTKTLGGGLTPASLDWLVRLDGAPEHAAAFCAYQADSHIRMACRAADGNQALAFTTPLGSVPPEELCVEMAWHNARGAEGPSGEPVCTEIRQPAAPIEEGCSTSATPGSWLWCGLFVLLRRRPRPTTHLQSRRATPGYCPMGG